MKFISFCLVICVFVLPRYDVQCLPMMNLTLPSLNDYRVNNNLPKLVWNDILETSASQMVRICPKQSNIFNQMVFIARGENAIYLPKVVKNAINHWANEEVSNKQLTWSQTQQVGCAISTCKYSLEQAVTLCCVFSPLYM